MFLTFTVQGALVVAGMLDFLTFALCSPYSETTDGKQFDMLLEKVAERGRYLTIFYKCSFSRISLSVNYKRKFFLKYCN